MHCCLRAARHTLEHHYLLQPGPVIDVAVEMPASCLRERDAKNHGYGDKRAMYVGVLAAACEAANAFSSVKVHVIGRCCSCWGSCASCLCSCRWKRCTATPASRRCCCTRGPRPWSRRLAYTSTQPQRQHSTGSSSSSSSSSSISTASGPAACLTLGGCRQHQHGTYSRAAAGDDLRHSLFYFIVRLLELGALWRCRRQTVNRAALSS